MIGVLHKPAELIGIQDIQLLIDTEVPEGQEIEFKETLPAEEGSVDPWLRGKNGIGKYARNCILEEAVAFANAGGGALILGIEESSEEPPIATDIRQIQRCADLANRLKMAFRDSVEPQIPRVEIFPVPIERENGVVVIRVGKSRLAPHRVWPTRSCKIRRADSSEEMRMREIQDLTLNVSRGLERLEKLFLQRSEKFEQEFQRLINPNHAVGVRATAVPVDDSIHFERVISHRRISQRLEEPWREVFLRRNDGNLHAYQARTFEPIYWRPMLRSARAEIHNDSEDAKQYENSYKEIHCNGLVESGFVSGPIDYRGSHELILEFGFPVVLFANLIAQAHRLRTQAGVPLAEYGIEVEISVKSRKAIVPRGGIAPPLGRFNVGKTRFPLYSLGEINDVPSLLDLFYRDFYNSVGQDLTLDQSQLEIEGWQVEEMRENAKDSL